MLSARDLKGIVTPVLTLLTPEDELDEPSLRRLVRYQVENGVSVLFALGSSGEFSLLPDDARRCVAEIICDEARGEASTVVGAIAEGAPRVLEQIREAQAAGGQAAVVTAPYYFGWSAEEIERFFARIADESPLPVILYDIPWRTHNPVARDTIVRLSEHPNIIGLKDTTTDAGRFVDLLLTLEGREDFALLQGSEPLALPSLLLGAAGAVFSLANLAPRTSVDLYEACRRGDLAEARRLQRVYNRLFAVFSLLDPGTGSIAGALGGLKVGLELMGIGTAKVHFPAAAPAREARAAVAALLRGIPETAGRLLTGRG